MVTFPPGAGNMGVPGANGYNKDRNFVGVWDVSNQQLGKGVWQPPQGPRIQNYKIANKQTLPFDTVQQNYPKPEGTPDAVPIGTHIGSAQEVGMKVSGPVVFTNKQLQPYGMKYMPNHWFYGPPVPFTNPQNFGGPTAKRVFGDNF